MMMNMRQLTLLVGTSSRKSSLLKLLAAPHSCKLIKRYSQQEGTGKEEMMKQRAPSTLEVLEQISHEKEETIRSPDDRSDHAFVSHSSDETINANKDAVGGGDDDVDSGQTYHKPRNN